MSEYSIIPINNMPTMGGVLILYYLPLQRQEINIFYKPPFSVTAFYSCCRLRIVFFLCQISSKSCITNRESYMMSNEVGPKVATRLCGKLTAHNVLQPLTLFTLHVTFTHSHTTGTAVHGRCQSALF